MLKEQQEEVTQRQQVELWPQLHHHLHFLRCSRLRPLPPHPNHLRHIRRQQRRENLVPHSIDGWGHTEQGYERKPCVEISNPDHWTTLIQCASAQED